MATVKLTKETVDALRPAAKDCLFWDQKLSGFGLKVTPAGGKIYLVQYRMGGRGAKTRRVTIGAHGNPWTAAGAKAEAERLLTQVKQGTDPADEKADRRRVSIELAFRSYSKVFLREYVQRKWKASYADAERILKLHVCPILKDKPLPMIRKADVTAVLSGIPAKQVALRRKVYAVVSRLFTWAVGRGDIDASPLAGFEPPPKPDDRDRVLTDDELRLAWLAAGVLGYPFGDLYRLLIATGQRRQEVAALDWRELDRAKAEWGLPAARAKNGVASVIHLSAPAIATLDGIADDEKWPKRGLVFSTTGETPVSGYSRAKSRLDAAMLKLARKEAKAAGEPVEAVSLDAWRAHDLRRTLATGMQRLGIRFEVVEAILNHVSGSRSGVAGIYQRHDWRSEKKAALDAWADHVVQLATGADQSNVVALAERRA